jgi:aromatic ring-opening dioxygenase catalytic subunit (LigB family)
MSKNSRAAEMIRGYQRFLPPTSVTNKLIVISAHYESPDDYIYVTKSTNLVYDYYGFPKETYDLDFPTLPPTNLATRVSNHLTRSGITSRIDFKRGFDHGLFVILKVILGEASANYEIV